jgi:hypothetical protein
MLTQGWTRWKSFVQRDQASISQRLQLQFQQTSSCLHSSQVRGVLATCFERWRRDVMLSRVRRAMAQNMFARRRQANVVTAFRAWADLIRQKHRQRLLMAKIFRRLALSQARRLFPYSNCDCSKFSL